VRRVVAVVALAGFVTLSSATSLAAPIEDAEGSDVPQLPTSAGGGSDGVESDGRPDFVVDVDNEDGSVGVAVAVVLPAGAETSTGEESVRPRCGWEKALVGDFRDAPGGVAREGQRSTDQVAEVSADGEVLSLGWWKTCSGVGSEFVWLAPTVDVQVLIDGAEARARAATPLPVPDIWVSPFWRTFRIGDVHVNTAEEDAAGARVRAVHVGFEVDFGNGDSTACEALGTPIVDFDIVEQGPCVWVYVSVVVA